MTKSPTARFSDRVENYVRYRPGYPAEVLDLLRVECGLQPSHTVADVASGTGVFTRLLKPGGWCVLIWNERRTSTTPFLCEYEQLLLTYGTDYKEVRHERTTAIIHEFFAPAPHQELVFGLRQQFDYEGTAGRLLSSSYAPLEGPSHAPMMQELQRIFSAHAIDDRVEFEYNTRVYYGRLDELK